MGGLTRLLEFLERLEKHRILFSLHNFRDDTIMVSFALVGERYEVDFFEDHTEFSVFTGDESVELNLDPVLKAIDEFG